MEQRAVENISGTVENVVFSNEENGWTVLELDSEGELVTVVGTLPGMVPGEEVVFSGRYASHPTYGRQFKAEVCERTLPATAAAIRKYLSSGAIKGIGPRTAQNIVDYFGDETLTVIEKQPEKLSEIRGISPAKARAIHEEYTHIFGIRSVMLELSRHGIEAAAAIRVWKHWGLLSMDVIEKDPYQLCCEAIAVPFEKADEIALRFQMEQGNPLRIRAGIAHVLSKNLQNGHTCLPADKLLPTACTLLGVEAEQTEDVLEQAVEDGIFLSDSVEGERYIYLPEMYEAETYIAGRIDILLHSASPEPVSWEKEIDGLEKELGISYADLQRKAISMALQNNIFILTGGPGTGKTTTLGAILTLLERTGDKVALAAPTGRAAKRMSEVCGREAKTIHRLLEVDFRDDDSDQVKFKRNDKNPLRLDTIILDEVSMVDTRLLCSLMRAMKLGCRLILVGDPDQLPSVGAGNILRDLITSDVVPMVHLSEIFRQAQQSHIVTSSHEIVRGEYPDLSIRDSDLFFLRQGSYEETMETVLNLCQTRLPKAYGYSPLWDIQVIAPSRVGALGTVELNRRLQERLNPFTPARVEHRFGSVTLREKDKVMQVRNNYDIIWRRDEDAENGGEEGTGVFNGDIGIIEMIDRPSQSILIRYDDRVAEYRFDMADEIEHAYAITVHKSQGSEFAAVVMPLMNYHPKLYYRNILYTAVTRARSLMILLGQQQTISRMVDNHRKVLRYTNLAAFLKQSVLG
ncbi:MAG: ATP-dependent RecD-like DNA helicase [Oscillospiraceae bacterium]